MIVSLTGEIQYHGSGYFVFQCNGLGYKIVVPDLVAQTFSGATTIYTHQVIRENEQELFGFLSMDAAIKSPHL